LSSRAEENVNSRRKMTKLSKEVARPRLISPFYIPGVFSASECKQIAKLESSKQQDEWWDGTEDDVSRRAWSSTLNRNDETNWIYVRLKDAFEAMLPHYGFDASYVQEDVLLARYEVGGHFDWHIDVGEFPSETRKLSISIQLSARKDYEGGQLEFFYSKTVPLFEKIGAAVVFPAFLPHRVLPVTKGERRALVAWYCGRPFR
jgi:PKHD-type hydroxylase